MAENHTIFQSNGWWHRDLVERNLHYPGVHQRGGAYGCHFTIVFLQNLLHWTCSLLCLALYVEPLHCLAYKAIILVSVLKSDLLPDGHQFN